VSRIAIKPYLINQDEDGVFRITVRETRFNSQNYPLVTTTILDGGFPSAFKARAYLRENYGAQATEITTK
jgi:hypothetical protein